MSYKLGDMVKFRKYVKRTGNDGIDSNVEYLTEEQQNILNVGELRVKFRDTYACKEAEGIVVGKRKLVFETDFFLHESYVELQDDVYQDQTVQRNNHYKDVYLVACNLSGFKRVLPEDMELLEVQP